MLFNNNIYNYYYYYYSLPFRIFASGDIEKIELNLNCNEEVIGYIADNVTIIQRSVKETGNREIVFDFVEKVLGMVVANDSDARDIKFVSIEFLSTEASFNYNPPIPPSLSSVILSSSTRSSEESSIDDGDSNFTNGDDVTGITNNGEDEDFKEGVTVEANVNLRDFSIFVAPSKALPLEMKLIPQTKAEWLLEESVTDTDNYDSNNNNNNNNNDDDYKLAPPTDVILAKYRLEYSEELNREPKHFISLSVSGIKLETDGAINPVMDFVNRSKDPELFRQLQGQQSVPRRNFGDGVNLDIQLCDIDFMHNDSKSESPLKASFKLLPRSEAGILYLRDKFTYKTTQMKIKHEKDISELKVLIDKSRKNVSELERMLIDSKVALANAVAEREEFSCSARRLQREKRSLENRVSQLKKEVDSYTSLFQAKGDEEMVKAFQSSLKNLFEENAQYIKENEALRVENEDLTKQLEVLRIKNNEEVRDIQKVLGLSVKMLQEENERLKGLVADRDRSLEEAQKALLDRQLLAEKLSEAERKMETQRRLADNAIRKSNFKSSSAPSVTVTQNMVMSASSMDAPAPTCTLALNSADYSSDVVMLHTQGDEPPQQISASPRQQQQQQQLPPPLPQTRPPQKHHVAPQTKPPSLPQVPSVPPTPPPPHKPPPPLSSHRSTTTTTTAMPSSQSQQYLPPRPKKEVNPYASNEANDHSKRRKIASGFNRFKNHINNGVTKMEIKLNK